MVFTLKGPDLDPFLGCVICVTLGVHSPVSSKGCAG